MYSSYVFDLSLKAQRYQVNVNKICANFRRQCERTLARIPKGLTTVAKEIKCQIGEFEFVLPHPHFLFVGGRG